MNSGISVVIPNFNGRVLLEANLPSVFSALKSTGLVYEVIVCDDGSTDDSTAFLSANYPQVILVAHKKNSGFSTNINSGLKVAKKDWVLALNNDVVLKPDYFFSLLHFFDSPDTFGVMGALLDPKSGHITDGAKLAEQTFFGTIRSTKNILREDGQSLPTLFLSGANALMDRKKLSEIGFFNEIFDPFYNEDVELSLRAWRKGWKCYFEPRAQAYHASSSTIGSISKKSRVRQVSLRNRFILHDLHLSSWERLLFFSKMAWDLCTRWVSLDGNFYKAFTSYFTLKQSVNGARQSLEILKLTKPVSRLVKNIQQEQLKNPHRIFA